MKRIRLKLKRSDQYYFDRQWYLHELRILRAKRRVAGLNTSKEVKTAQRALAKIRKEEHV